MNNYHQAPFPYEIQGKYPSIEIANHKGWQSHHLWGVFHAQGAVGYAPPHVPGADYFVATNETHDCATYYEEDMDDDEID